MGEVAKTLVSLSGPSAVHGFIPKAFIAYYPDANASRADEAEDGKQPERWVSADAPLKDHLGSSPLGSQYGKLTIVENMHERKRKMAEQVFAGGPGSGFVALPGGYGTLEEIAEVTTWNQLGIHDKGIVLLNVDGFWDGLVGWIRTAARQKFVAEANKEILVECNKVDEVMGALKAYKPGSGRLSLSWNLK